MIDAQLLLGQLSNIIELSHTQLSDIKPSVWAESRVIMEKPFPGPLRYEQTPYTREIIDCAAPDHPARVIIVKKGAQIGFSATVIMPCIGWMIENNPGNAYLTVGDEDLIEPAMGKMDSMIDNAGIRKLIQPQALRRRATKTGDTNKRKEYPGGFTTIYNASKHKGARQVDLQYGWLDDWEAVRRSSKQSGNTLDLWMQRFAAYKDTKKVFIISTPEVKGYSNIEDAYLLGDQRKFHVPCPNCSTMIVWEWNVEVEINGVKTQAGITWETDEEGHLIPTTVGYICQSCGEFFDEKHKHRMLNSGEWVPTAKPHQEGYYSYHISSLYAPIWMDGWTEYVYKWLKANPQGQPVDDGGMKVFTNVCLGEPYESASESPAATQIMKNTRDYDMFTVPEKQSINDGNGRIVLITCAADMNGTIFNEGKGTVDDARIDYEVVAWSESGASYSICHGSIGTFIPLEGTMKYKADRTKWTYAESDVKDKDGEVINPSVWPELYKIMTRKYLTEKGVERGVGITLLDTGHFTTFAYNFIEKHSREVKIYGVKGDKEEEFIRHDANASRFKVAMERKDLYILKVGLIKDTLSDHMQLNWNSGSAENQPSGFMNFPYSTTIKDEKTGLITQHYSYKGFYDHYEAENRISQANADGTGLKSIWKKKKSNNQNHFFDCRVYNIAAKEILTQEIGMRYKIKPFTWADMAKILVAALEHNGL